MRIQRHVRWAEKRGKHFFALKGRTFGWRGHLLVTTDQHNFYYKYTPSC